MFVKLILLIFENNPVFIFLNQILEAITRKLLDMFILNETFSSISNNKNTYNPELIFFDTGQTFLDPWKGRSYEFMLVRPSFRASARLSVHL